ncbi:hypothetical protein [Nocardia sp. NBC_01388]|uniref:hypothetical protein n=1 Tax=Nocardia sp. NBC_01388 TaxID=2903596 RepID=UPI003254D6F5
MASSKNSRGKSGRAATTTLVSSRPFRGTLLTWAGAALVVVALVAGVTISVVHAAHAKREQTAAVSLDHPPATTAIGRDIAPPWPAPADAAAAVRAAGLPMLASEGAVEHIHVHIDVLVDGSAVPVVANLGVDRIKGAMSPLHTHDASGVVHIESPAQRQFGLGELFSEWGVSRAGDNVGTLRAGDGKNVRIFVNGTLRQGNPAALTFANRDEVAIVYGPPDSATAPPARYDFPSGT